ncbi:MAG TPA: hypothetical protein VM490_03790, partial [Armatimonadaceae bacterium]|nr:hypothetical protein [Armatimonadaceae bacterium]
MASSVNSPARGAGVWTSTSGVAARGLQAVGPGGEHAADQVVAQLGRRRVQDAGEEAALDERLHRLPARARGVEDEHLVTPLLERLARPRHARRGDAEHRGADQRLLLAEVHLGRLHHARHRGRRVGEDAAGDRVDPGHVGHGGHQRDVGPADVVARV